MRRTTLKYRRRKNDSKSKRGVVKYWKDKKANGKQEERES